MTRWREKNYTCPALPIKFENWNHCKIRTNIFNSFLKRFSRIKKNNFYQNNFLCEYNFCWEQGYPPATAEVPLGHAAVSGHPIIRGLEAQLELGGGPADGAGVSFTPVCWSKYYADIECRLWFGFSCSTLPDTDGIFLAGEVGAHSAVVEGFDGPRHTWIMTVVLISDRLPLKKKYPYRSIGTPPPVVIYWDDFSLSV